MRTAIVVSLAILGALARADPQVSATVTDDLTAAWHGDNHNGRNDDDDYGVLINQLHLAGDANGLAARVLLHAHAFHDAPDERYRDAIEIERMTAEFIRGDLKLVAGDMYQQLGRGIVLSLRKADDVSTDVALRGGQVQFASALQAVKGFAGVTNPSSMDYVSQRAIEDVDDVLVGGSYELRRLGFATPGALVLYNQPEERILASLDRTFSGGLYLDMPALVSWLSLYAEVDGQYRELAGSRSNGLAAYFTADLQLGDWALLIEGLLLDDFEQRGSRNSSLGTRFEYNRPPTLERIEEEVTSNRDVVGGRLRLEHYLVDLDLLLFASAVVRVNEMDQPSQILQLHGFAGFELYFQQGASRLAGSGGYRHESNVAGAAVKTMAHGELDYLQAIAHGFALHLSLRHESRTLADAPYMRGSAFFGLEKGGLGSATVEFGYDTQDPSDEVRNLFLAGILALDLHQKVKLRAIAGTQRGGIKCIAGVCREFPAFAGVRSELAVSY